MTRVLLIDDDDDVRLIIGTGLEVVGGFDVVTAASGPEGLDLARREPPDAIVVDLKMPGMDGPAVIAAVRQDDRLRSLPMVLLTAAAGGLDDSALHALDVEAVLGKPVDPADLTRALEELLTEQPDGDGADGATGDMDEVLRDTWTRLRPRVLERLHTLDVAQRRAAAGDLPADQREAALTEAHRLAGSLGTYGFHDASDAARTAELVLERDPLDADALARALAQLRGALSA